MTKMISPGQLKMIWGLTRQMGMEEDLLRERARLVSGQESLKKLTASQAAQLIDGLQGKPQPAACRASKGQTQTILALASRLGWAEDPNRLRGWILSRYGVERLEWLNSDQAILCIEALKGMLAGGRGERKGYQEKETARP